MHLGLPAGTGTFLFSQIADSTRCWEEEPTAMAESLRVHDAVVRGAVERHGGYVFATADDGMRSAFSTPATAAAAAVEAQEQLREAGASNYAVRMALHTAEASERDGGYSGNEVTRAARLLLLAHGGQVLVSDATEVLLRNRVALRSLGDNQLDGRRGRMSPRPASAPSPDESGLPGTSGYPGELGRNPNAQPVLAEGGYDVGERRTELLVADCLDRRRSRPCRSQGPNGRRHI